MVEEPDLPELAQFRARLDRASASYKAFGAAWEAYLDERPHRLVTRVEDGAGTLQLKRVIPMPADLSLILSEFLHHLRAALDNCLYAVAVIDSGVNPPPGAGALQWPICDSSAAFDGQRRRLKHLRPDIVEALEAIQPYQAELPGWNALRLLNELARVDRHRSGHVFALVLVAARMQADKHVISDIRLLVDDTVDVDDGDVMVSFRYSGADELGPDHIDGDFEWEVDIAGFELAKGPSGRVGRPWGTLASRLRSMHRATFEYTEGLLDLTLNPLGDDA